MRLLEKIKRPDLWVLAALLHFITAIVPLFLIAEGFSAAAIIKNFALPFTLGALLLRRSTFAFWTAWVYTLNRLFILIPVILWGSLFRILADQGPIFITVFIIRLSTAISVLMLWRRLRKTTGVKVPFLAVVFLALLIIWDLFVILSRSAQIIGTKLE